MNTFEQKILIQVDLTKNSVCEVFVNQRELRQYWGLEGDKESSMMQKVYVAIYDGEIVGLSFERKRAISNLLDAADVETLEELN